MKAKTVAEKAAGLVSGDRKAAYGDVTEGIERIAAIWNGILAAAGAAPARPLNAHDVANMMEGLKIARRYTGPYRADNYIDGAGWSAVAGEAGEKMR
ncbi:DUF6378 domain-containing protein [Bradyrhizobium sp. AUGA SZCCT0160]|uniref:DUF6378 domain-containing protein n=1 Tax=Bradyrhizobium sp. AUGA SZCCT0160 TaxID=2807662 RepID=UPI001BAD28AB|nr:DUF6378 domain-containing protein [Bradyrhizobium sp. AUGA SZCCT0160]MBR1193220.1 hypothetical protein [Bradyrhizobium sp. AUGA SZCCT0160]